MNDNRNGEERRPDPDELLARIRDEAEQARRGKLKIFFGASPGVGKTYAMLSTARHLREQGVDAVIGVVETHGRAETERLAAGLERLPLRRIEVRGRQYTEFDLDAALARRPALVLVDELAHSNVEGSRHPKRWQDVEELLSAGIDVYSTVNVQHLDTLNDVVSGITGIRVWETVPDRVFDRADEVVLVDLTPDELLQRLRQGKVYMPQQAERAIRNFFRKGNLIALRELALRRTADRVDVEMLQYRRDQSVEAIWRTRESLLACVGPGAEGDPVVRSAARLATRLEVPWHAIYVETPRLSRASQARRKMLIRQLELAQSLGAETAVLAGNDAAEVALKYARDHNLSRLVVGRARPGWGSAWPAARLLLGRSFAARLAAAAPDLEITSVAGPARSPAVPGATGETEPGAEIDWKGYAWSAAGCALAALVALPLYSVFALPNIAMVFLLAVVLIAVRFGRGPAVLASFLSVAEFDFFYVPPRFSFAVSDAQYLLTFAVMLAVGLIAGQLTAGLRYQANVATGRASRVRALYEMARELSGALLPEQIAEICGRFVSAEFGVRSTLLLVGLDDRIVPRPPDASGAELPVDMGIAQWVVDHEEPAGPGTNTLPAGPVLYLPLKAPMRLRGLLAIEAASTDPDKPARAGVRLLTPEQIRLLDTVTRLIAIALERVHYVEVAQQSTLQMESERLRNSLLAAISHDLRTPLTGLVGLVDALALTPPQLSQRQREITDEAREHAQHLRSLVENLLDMARLQSGRVALNRQWNSIEELVGVSLRVMGPALGPRQVRVHLPPELPLAEFDASLMERVLCNILENAAKFTPPGSHIDIGASAEPGRILLWIDDDGPGLPPGKEEEIFEKFERGDKESATPGVGLGLAICRAILQAHGGTIRAQNRPTSGARFLIDLPSGTPPEAEAEAAGPGRAAAAVAGQMPAAAALPAAADPLADRDRG
jgi:two-component system sensor histidine kinase KdpD